MTGYDFNRPFADSSTFPFYTAIDGEVASRYGRTVRAMEMSNAEYDTSTTSRKCLSYKWPLSYSLVHESRTTSAGGQTIQTRA